MKLARVLSSSFVSLALIAGGAACTITSTDPGPSNTSSSGGTPGSSGGTTPGDGTSSSSGSSGAATSSSSSSSSSGSVGGETINENEPGNDTFAGAEVVKINDTVKATFSKKEDDDHYSITIPAGTQDGVFTITIVESSNEINPRVELFTKDQTLLKTFDTPDKTTNPSVFKWDATAGATYILKVSDYYGSPNAAAYTMKATFDAVLDTYERNDTFADAKEVSLGKEFDLFLFAGDQTNKGDDDDYFIFNVPASAGKLHVKVKNNSPNGAEQDHRVELFDSNKAHKETFDAPNKQADLDHLFDVPAGGGTVYLKFTDYYRTNSTVASKVTVTAE